MAEARKQPRVVADVTALLDEGVAVVVATRDAELRPEITRGWGPVLSAGGERLTVCVHAGAGTRTVSNLAADAPIAVSASQPSTYRSVQIKGTVVELGDPTADQVRRAEEHHAAFAADVLLVGIPSRLAPRFFDGGALVAVTVAVHELFDQTPGPKAGAAL